MPQASFLEIIHARLLAEFPRINNEQYMGIANSMQQAASRGLEGGVAFAMYAHAYAEGLRFRGEWVWRVVSEHEPAPDEDLQLLAIGLKRTVREYLGHEGGGMAEIRQYAQRHPREGGAADSLEVQVRAKRDGLLRELDSRIDAYIYKQESRAKIHAASITAAPKLLDQAALIRRANRKLDTKNLRTSWNKEWDALRAEGKTRMQAAQLISQGPLGAKKDGTRYTPAAIVRQLSSKPKQKG